MFAIILMTNHDSSLAPKLKWVLQRAYRHKLTEGPKFHTCAALFYRGNCAALGYNSLKTHPLQARFARNSGSIFLHAEIDALVKGLRNLTLEELSSTTIYIARAKGNRGGPLIGGKAEPCIGCTRALAAFNIRKIIHT